jgi:glucosylceramidase
MQYWLTTPDQKHLLAPYTPPTNTNNSGAPVIAVLETPVATIARQKMIGFGASLTDSSAYLLAQLSEKTREATLRDLFDTKTGLGFSALRIPIGATDFSSRGSYTYQDKPDMPFDVSGDEVHILPILRQIKQINPEITFYASPWTAPAWMKTNKHLHGGWLDWAHYEDFAQYLVLFLKEYQKRGIPIAYLCVQNEPRHESNSYPTMRMEPRDQLKFIKSNLYPALKRAKIATKTKILLWDHNWDAPEFPLEILADPEIGTMVTGVAWHGYGGNPDAQEKVRLAHPTAEVHFTESSGGEWATDFGGNLRWDTNNLLIDSVRYGARSVMKWNLALDEKHGPQNGGCTDCRGIITIHSQTKTVTKNVEYYSFGHSSKFVKPGATRLYSASDDSKLSHVAYKNPDGSYVLVLANLSEKEQAFTLKHKKIKTLSRIPAGSVMTIVWK